MHAILEYTYGEDYLAAREAHRAAHLKVAWAAAERGELVLGGAVGDGPFTGLLIFRGDDAEAAHAAASRFAETDPYVVAGLVIQWRARPWMTVVGETAATPVRPESLTSVRTEDPS